MEFLNDLAGYQLSYVELFGTIFGFLCVFLMVRENVWCWPTGLISVGLYIVVFYEARLYADMGLHVIYVVLSIYGWYQWLYGGEDGKELPIGRLTLRLGLALAALVLVGSVLLGYALAHYTDADLPYWDATTTAVSLIAQWMLAKKLLENWAVWIGVDVLYVGIYFYKALYLTTLLYALYLVLAALGLRAWHRTHRAALHTETRPAPATPG